MRIYEKPARVKAIYRSHWIPVRSFIQNFLAACSLALLCAAPVQAQNAERVALVVGNSAYRTAPLFNPQNDAKAMSNLLRNAGFAVDQQVDTSLDALQNAVAQFGKAIADPKVKFAVFYYAGHGVQLDWRNYLVPVTANIRTAEDVRNQTVDVSSLLAYMGAAKNKNYIIILDACRDDPFAGAYRAPAKGLSQFDAPVGSVLAYSTSPGKVALDGEGSNGLYTAYLLKEFAVKGVKIEDAFKRTRLNVRLASNGAQVPWETTSLEEDLYLFPEARKHLSDAEQDTLLEQELQAWAKVKNSNDFLALAEFIRVYPSGSVSELAASRMNRLLSVAHERESRGLVAKSASLQAAELERTSREEALRLAAEKAEASRVAAAQAEAARQEALQAETTRQETLRAETQRAQAVAAQREAQAQAEAQARWAQAQSEQARAEHMRVESARAEAARQEALQTAQRAQEAAARQQAQRAQAEREQAARQQAQQEAARAALAAEQSARQQAEAARAALLAVQQNELAKQAAAPVSTAQTAPILIASATSEVLASTPYFSGATEHLRRYSVGDSFSFRVIDQFNKSSKPLEMRVTALDFATDQVQFNNGEYVADLMGNILTNLRGSSSTPRQFYPADMLVGKRWRTQFKQVRAAAGVTYTFRYDLKVVGKERVTVPAGTFDCFKIEARGYNMELGARLERNIWVAPGVNADIAHETLVRLRNGQIEQNERQELVSYKQTAPVPGSSLASR